MLTIRNAQMKAMADAAPGRQIVSPCQPTWIEVHLIDADGNPIPGQRYRIQLPDSTVKEGSLDQEGKVRLEGIPAGQTLVTFLDLDGREWTPTKAPAGNGGSSDQS